MAPNWSQNWKKPFQKKVLHPIWRHGHDSEKRDPPSGINPVRGDEQAGHRPVLVLSLDIFNERSGTVIALAITSQPQHAEYPLTWKIASLIRKSGMDQDEPNPYAFHRTHQ
jgi:hypothetical protein